MLEIDRLAISS